MTKDGWVCLGFHPEIYGAGWDDFWEYDPRSVWPVR